MELHGQHAAGLRLGGGVGAGHGLQVEAFHRSGHQALQDLFHVDAPLGLTHADDGGGGGGFPRLHAGRLGQALLRPLDLGGQRGDEPPEAVFGVGAVEEGGGLLLSDPRVRAGEGALSQEALRGSSLECWRRLCWGGEHLTLFSDAQFVGLIRPGYDPTGQSVQWRC